MSGVLVPAELALAACLVALFAGLYVGVRAGRWSAGSDDWPPDDPDGKAW